MAVVPGEEVVDVSQIAVDEERPVVEEEPVIPTEPQQERQRDSKSND